MGIFDLSGKRILVTGASSGIGRACAIMAAQLGASVILTGRRADALDGVVAVLHGEGHQSVVGDIASECFLDELVSKCGKVDGLVHAAGVAPMCPIGFVGLEQVQSVMNVNYLAFLQLMKRYSRQKNRSANFSAVAISSVSAFVGWGGGTVYCGSKGALSASVRALALELSSKNIRVNAVCPSNIKTPMYERGAAEMNDAESEKKLISRQPLGLGVPEQVAAPVCFLLSDAASFITGVNLPVDGGYLAQ